MVTQQSEMTAALSDKLHQRRFCLLNRATNSTQPLLATSGLSVRAGACAKHRFAATPTPILLAESGHPQHLKLTHYGLFECEKPEP